MLTASPEVVKAETPAFTKHVPAMVTEVLAHLDTSPGGVFVDATAGGGGHAQAVMRALPGDTRYVGLDLDPAALARAGSALISFRDRVLLKQTSFRELARAAEVYAGRVTNVLFDLGLSSDQLADAERGFSFDAGGRLDMRFGADYSPLTAEEIVNSYGEKELADLIFHYGEERRARAIARVIVNTRRRAPIKTAKQLGELLASRVPGRSRIHPATRTFQALRIAVNDELAALEEALPQAAALLAPGGRLLVISYHSLEDRVVKLFVRENVRAGVLTALTPKPLRPQREEIRVNARCRSAHLRVAARA